MTSTGVRIDPRIRDRRIAVQRQAGRKRLRVLVIIMAFVCALGLAYLAITSPLLDVDRVRVTGTQHLSVADIETAARVKIHDPLVFVNTGAVARRIEALPWVQHAVVRRSFPGTVRITVSEYAPAAFIRVGSGALLLAANGRALARVAGTPANLVEVRGVRLAPAPGDVLAPVGAADLVAHLPSALAHQVAAVDVSGQGIALVLKQGGSIRLANTDDLDAKAASALAVLAHLGTAPFTYIDVSTPARPISK